MFGINDSGVVGGSSLPEGADPIATTPTDWRDGAAYDPQSTDRSNDPLQSTVTLTDARATNALDALGLRQSERQRQQSGERWRHNAWGCQHSRRSP